MHSLASTAPTTLSKRRPTAYSHPPSLHHLANVKLHHLSPRRSLSSQSRRLSTRYLPPSPASVHLSRDCNPPASTQLARSTRHNSTRCGPPHAAQPPYVRFGPAPKLFCESRAPFNFTSALQPSGRSSAPAGRSGFAAPAQSLASAMFINVMQLGAFVMTMTALSMT